eukprot:2504022-Alexandrium_andersonii.AAC.1
MLGPVFKDAISCSETAPRSTRSLARALRFSFAARPPANRRSGSKRRASVSTLAMTRFLGCSAAAHTARRTSSRARPARTAPGSPRGAR